MNDFIIEDGILKAYLGSGKVVIVPIGVKQIGGEIKKGTPKELTGDRFAYKAFYCNEIVEELYLPDSVETIGFKALEHCRNLRVLSFSNNVKNNMQGMGVNALNGCSGLRTILYRGTIYEFSCYEFNAGWDLDAVYCTDGVIKLHQEFYIDTFHYPGTREEWDRLFDKNDWRNRRSKRVICCDEQEDM